MTGQRGIIGIAILAFLGSIVGLCMLGVDIASAIGSGFVIAFFSGVGAAFLSVPNLRNSRFPMRSQPYENVKYGTAASEVMELRQGLTTQDVGNMIDGNAKKLRGD
jgi:hypothetical protein